MAPPAAGVQLHMRLAFACVLLAACTQEHYYAIDELPVTEWTSGLPLAGDGHMTVWIARPPNDWSKAVGFVRFRCTDCKLGDDEAQIHVPMLGDDSGVEFGHIAIDKLTADADFADGRMKLDVEARSDDFALEARIDGILAPRADDIELDGCIVFRPTEALRERAPKTHDVISLTGAPLHTDHMFHITIGGTLGNMRRLGQVCSLVR